MITNHSEYHNYRDAAQYWHWKEDDTLAKEAAREAVRAAGLDPAPLNDRELYCLASVDHMLPKDPNLLHATISHDFQKSLARI